MLRSARFAGFAVWSDGAVSRAEAVSNNTRRESSEALAAVVRVDVFGAHAVAGARILAAASHGTRLLITSEVSLARVVPDLLVRSGARNEGSRERFLLSSAAFLGSITRAEFRVVCAVTLAVTIIFGALARACDGGSCTGTALLCLVTGTELRKSSAVTLAVTVIFLRLTSAEDSPIRNCQNCGQKFRVVS